MLHLLQFGDEENPYTMNEKGEDSTSGVLGISVKHMVPLSNRSCPSGNLPTIIQGWLMHFSLPSVKGFYTDGDLKANTVSLAKSICIEVGDFQLYKLFHPSKTQDNTN